MIGLLGRSGRAGRLATPVAAALLAVVLGSCSDEPGDGAGTRTEPAGDPDRGFFVDRDYLATHCESSGIAYPLKTEERVIDGRNPPPGGSSRVERHRALLAETLGMYPRQFFEEVGIRKVVLCDGLAADGVPARAFADVEHGTLYFAADTGLPDATLARYLHHEIFHFVDFAEDSRLDEDSAWSALNPGTFQYGGGGATMQGDDLADRPDDTLPGFLDRYATSGLAEDKAETYALLIADNPTVRRRAASDPVLARKVERIRVALARFGPLAPRIP